MKKNNILITIDEMQSGFYRTGKKFAYEYYGFTFPPENWMQDCLEKKIII